MPKRTPIRRPRVVFPDRPKVSVTATVTKEELIRVLTKITVDDENFDPRHWCMADVRQLEQATSFVFTALREEQARLATRAKDTLDHVK